MTRPKVNSDSQKELDRAQEQFDAFDASVKAMTNDRMNMAPAEEREQQTQMSTREAKKYDAPYIKPLRSINSKEQFNEKYREDWRKDWEYVKCIAENNEIIGESIEMWTKKYAGDPAHQWKVPVNTPVYIPRLVAKQISNCKYHRLRMEDRQTEAGSGMSYYGSITVDSVKNRLDCRQVNEGFTTASF
jgi:hypothetical protein